MKSKNKHQKTNNRIICLTLILGLILFPGCSSISRNNYYSDSINGVYFDTLISVTLYDTNTKLIEENLKKSTQLCKKYENLFNANIEESDIYKINHSAGNTVEVSPETIFLLKKSLEYSAISNGLFDVTIKSASQLWDFHQEEGQIPSKASIEQALNHIDYHNITINEENNTVTLNDSQCQIDIGGIAKGYIADKISESLQEAKIHGAIINMGGDITLLGNKNEKDNFNIGITDPFGGNTPILAVNTSNKAIATSGTYERAFFVNGKQYHHILNPQDGYPVTTDVVSATTITQKGIDADTLCTISILLGSRKAIELINELPDTEGIIICENHEILYSEGAKEFLK